MERVLIIVYPVKSHFIALFGLANTLAKQNYEIIFVGKGSALREYVEAQGFNYRGLEAFPFAMNFERFNNIKGMANYFANIYRRSIDELFLQRRRELVALIDTVRPSTVLIDQKINSDFIVLFRSLVGRNIKVAFIQTMLNTYRTQSNMPINCSYYSSSKLKRDVIWKAFEIKITLKRLFNAIIYWGFDNESIKIRKMRQQRMPAIISKNKSNLFQFCFKSIPELILSTEDLEIPPVYHTENQHYIGPMIHIRRKEIDADKDLSLDLIIEGKNNNKTFKVIYCSFGTLYGKNTNRHVSWISKLLKVARLRPQYHFVISFDKNLIPSVVDLPSNVRFFDFVDQLKLLPLTDLFISAAGIKSIKESILFEVPMLIYPWNEHDHYSNSKKVELLGIGLRGNLKKDTVIDIAKAIDCILHNAAFRDNVIKIKEKTLKYNDELFFRIFDGLPRLDEILAKNTRPM
jgi:UDP:flavonoid glycosyltransferase YjiC (YdhE family)